MQRVLRLRIGPNYPNRLGNRAGFSPHGGQNEDIGNEGIKTFPMYFGVDSQFVNSAKDEGHFVSCFVIFQFSDGSCLRFIV